MRKCPLLDMETAAQAGDIAHKLPGLAILNYGVPGSEAELLGCQELAQAVFTCGYVCGFTATLVSLVCSFVLLRKGLILLSRLTLMSMVRLALGL